MLIKAVTTTAMEANPAVSTRSVSTTDGPARTTAEAIAALEAEPDARIAKPRRVSRSSRHQPPCPCGPKRSIDWPIHPPDVPPAITTVVPMAEKSPNASAPAWLKDTQANAAPRPAPKIRTIRKVLAYGRKSRTPRPVGGELLLLVRVTAQIAGVGWSNLNGAGIDVP
jgi:hypothetical protein